MAITYQFLLAMLVGAIINLAGFTLNFAEQWFAVSVIVFSLITLFVPRTSAILAYWNSFFFFYVSWLCSCSRDCN